MTHAATSGNPMEERGAGSAGSFVGSGSRNDTPALRAVRLLLFAAAREAAGTRQVDLSAATVGDLLGQARERFGPGFGAVLDRSRVWVNGEPCDPSTPLSEGDEVAVLPPVSGG